MINIGYVYLSTYSYRRYMRQTQPIRRNVNGGILFVYTRGYLGLSLDIKYSLYPLLCSSSLLPALSQTSQPRNLVNTFCNIIPACKISSNSTVVSSNDIASKVIIYWKRRVEIRCKHGCYHYFCHHSFLHLVRST